MEDTTTQEQSPEDNTTLDSSSEELATTEPVTEEVTTEEATTENVTTEEPSSQSSETQSSTQENETTSKEEVETASKAEQETTEAETPTVKTAVINITKGMRCMEVADILYKKGIIDDAEAFNQYMRQHKYTQEILIGTYTLNSSMSFDEIADKIVRKF